MKENLSFKVAKYVFGFEWDTMQKTYVKKGGSGQIKLKSCSFDQNYTGMFSVIGQMKRNGFKYIISDEFIMFKHKKGIKIGMASLNYKEDDDIKEKVCECAIYAMEDMEEKEKLYRDSLRINKMIKELTEREDYYAPNGVPRNAQW